MLLSKIKKFYSETIFGKSGYKLDEHYAQYLINTSTVLEDGEGIVIARVDHHPYFKDKVVASELVWYVPPEKRNSSLGYRLFKKYEQWAKDNSADIIMVDCLDDKVAKFYESQGYKLVQRTYMKELT